MVEGNNAAPPIAIKKYANRRLYNTATSSYVTLEHLCQMVKDGKEFLVHDAKTGEDITRSVLTQIIFEEENKGNSLLPVSFLRQLITFYGDSLQALLPGYLDVSLSAFSRNQEQMRRYLADAFGEMFPFKRFEEMGRQNMVLFQRAMSMFNPFAGGAQGPGGAQGLGGAQGPGESAGPPAGESAEDIAALRQQLDSLQKRLDRIAKKP